VGGSGVEEDHRLVLWILLCLVVHEADERSERYAGKATNNRAGVMIGVML
jgi:hypothetical protein